MIDLCLLQHSDGSSEDNIQSDFHSTQNEGLIITLCISILQQLEVEIEDTVASLLPVTYYRGTEDTIVFQHLAVL